MIKYLNRHQIPRRGHQPGVDNLLYSDLDREFLTSRFEAGMGLHRIAPEAGSSTTAVKDSLRRLGLMHLLKSTRPPDPACASKEELARLYAEEKLSLEEIGKRLGTSRTKVRADLSRLGLRPYSRPGFKPTDGTWVTD